jgi:hypothetical protein
MKLSHLRLEKVELKWIIAFDWSTNRHAENKYGLPMGYDNTCEQIIDEK